MSSEHDVSTQQEFLECEHADQGSECIKCGAPWGVCVSCGMIDWLWEETCCCSECEEAAEQEDMP